MIYLDNAATTRPDPAVLEEMALFQDERTGNASSIHRAGVYAATGIEKARAVIAARINALPEEIIFTSGGTESNNCALKGAAFALRHRGNHIVTTAIEHSSVLEPLRWLASMGYEVTFLPVDSEGRVDPDDVRKKLRKDTILVSVMHANNEIGTIEPIEEIGRLCRERGVLFHTDACQSFTKTIIDAQRQNIDLLSLNAHKIHGPRGVGALYIRNGVALVPLHHGGGQEQALRSGTSPVESIAGFGKAVGIVRSTDVTAMAALRDDFLRQVRCRLPAVTVNGSLTHRLCNNINLRFPGVDGKALFLALNRENIMVSAGSACHASKDTPSHVLRAIGLSDAEAKSSLRISLSKWTTGEELEQAIELLCRLVKEGNIHA
jgi:cysteine desulfurase